MTCGLLVRCVSQSSTPDKQLEFLLPSATNLEGWEASGGPKASQGSGSALQWMSGDPLLGFMSNGHKSLKVIETEGSSVAPGAGLILERPREGRCEERSFLTDILPDRGLNVAAAKRVSGFCCW